jgi:hypothetical protein
MTDQEQQQIDTWLDASREQQPATGTMALLIYVRDGKVVLESTTRSFPNADLLAANELIDEYIDGVLTRADANQANESPLATIAPGAQHEQASA